MPQTAGDDLPRGKLTAPDIAPLALRGVVFNGVPQTLQRSKPMRSFVSLLLSLVLSDSPRGTGGLTSRRSPRREAHRRFTSLRPRLEALEDRTVPSATISAPASLSTLASFNPYPNGTQLFSGVIEDSRGNFFGTAYEGGASGVGTVYEVAADSNTVTTIASFNNANGAYPYAGLVEDSGGNLFGTTSAGGATGAGTVFEVAAGSNTIISLASFNYGAYPRAGLIEDSNGNLFGTTYAGGASDVGTVFELAAGSNTITTLASFNNTNGASPYAGLVEDTSGNLFGTTEEGGANGDGTVYKVVAGSNTITTIASFNYTNGALPYAGLVEDSSGNLFGTTPLGGANGVGTVYEVAAGSNTVTTLASFNGTNGSNVRASLIEDSSGNLFGTSNGGGANGNGTVFEVAAGSDTITTLASFNDNVNGPLAGLIEDSNGNLFGTTSGTSSVAPTVFELAAGSNTIINLASFNYADGSNPQSGVVEDSSGNLFGTTEYGGASGYGTVYEVAAGSKTITTIASFDDTNGAYPCSGLVEDSTGNLFGITSRGGGSDFGTVYEVAAGSKTITALASFEFSNGTNIDQYGGPLVEDNSGNLFGTTFGGGTSGAGTVFELAAGSNTITTLASFNVSSGDYPLSGVVADSSGNLFGTTRDGGANGYGTVFELANGSDTITALASFSYASQGHASPLFVDSSGNLFGTASGGANDVGMLYELAAGSNTITTLASFNFDNGTGAFYPNPGLLKDSSGNLFGTSLGGAGGYGTVFELAAGSNTITTLVSFNKANGFPNGGLVEDSNGNLFGTTFGGGTSGAGTVFEVQDTPSVSVNAQSETYNAQPYSLATATVTGLGGATITDGSVTFTYYVHGSSTPLASAPTNAGTYDVQANFSGDTEYAPASSTATFTIGQATLTVVTNSSLMLAGNSPPPLTGSVNGTSFTGTINYTTANGDIITVTLGTAATASSPVGQYDITATLSGANAGDYAIDPATSRTGTRYVVSIGADPSSTTGAQAVTFWDNKGNKTLITAADLSSLDALNLVNQGGADFDPHSVAQLQAWLSVSPNATAAYRLAVQLAAMDLNVLAGDVKATDLVYASGLLPYATADSIAGLTSGGFIDVQDLMSAANAALALVNPGNPSNDPNAAYELALANILQAANGNTIFVQQQVS